MSPTPTKKPKAPPVQRAERIEIIAARMTEILETMDEMDREGIEGTPERMARMFMDEVYCPGNPLEEVLNTVFVEKTHNREMVTIDHIPFCSWCEHHMLPYFGYAHVAYIPHSGLIGLSKIARLVEAAGQGLTIQERVTDRVADALDNKLQPSGVAVVIRATHTCMIARGVKAVGSMTTTSAIRGVFRDSEAARAEFFSIVFGNGKA